MSFKECILPTNLKYMTNTTDLVFIEDSFWVDGGIEPTDWALVNGFNSLLGCYWVGDRYETGISINKDGHQMQTNPICRDIGFRPEMHLDIEKVIEARKLTKTMFKIMKSEEGYFLLEFGEYPNYYVGDDTQDLLKRAYRKNVLDETGKSYLARIDQNGKCVYAKEYEYGGYKYVMIDTKFCSDGFASVAETVRGYQLTQNQDVFIQVMPLTWKIKNWDELPKELNPYGKGTAKHIDIVTENAIGTLPFHISDDEKFNDYWQNSTIRGYLNGINVNNIKTNGDSKFAINGGGDFSNENNFLTEAFNFELSEIMVKPAENRTKRTRRNYGVQVAETPMSISEQIKFYINSGTSFMLHGPSGVGKTRRIEEADPEFVSIVLRNGILPEEVIGKIIFPNNDKTTGGIWVPPAWYVSLCEKCKNQPDKNHVLFIDEITNVKPSEQSLVFHLVLNNSIGPNVGKLPENVVVVAAGNNKEESEAAYNMPEPLFRRFDGHIYLEADIKQWLEWGSEPSKKGKGRLKIHPIVSAFVATYAEDVFYSSYDSEEPPKYALDPRGWEQISDIIYNNKGIISKELISNKVGEKIAANFIEFAKNPPLMLEEILEDNYDEEDIPHKFDAQYALAISLRNANFEQVAKVREFVANNLNGEILPMFDSVWVGEDSERAIFMNELQQTQNEKVQENENIQIEQEVEEQEKPKRINVDEFWQSENLLGINCKELLHAKILMKVFSKMHKQWKNGEPYGEDSTRWFTFREDTVYLNNREYGNIEWTMKTKCKYYDFSDIDLSKYLEVEDISKILEEKSRKRKRTKMKKKAEAIEGILEV